MDSEIPEFDLEMGQKVVKYLKNFYGKYYDLTTDISEKIRKENRTKDRRNTIMNCWRLDEDESIRIHMTGHVWI